MQSYVHVYAAYTSILSYVQMLIKHWEPPHVLLYSRKKSCVWHSFRWNIKGIGLISYDRESIMGLNGQVYIKCVDVDASGLFGKTIAILLSVCQSMKCIRANMVTRGWAVKGNEETESPWYLMNARGRCLMYNGSSTALLDVYDDVVCCVMMVWLMNEKDSCCLFPACRRSKDVPITLKLDSRHTQASHSCQRCSNRSL